MKLDILLKNRGIAIVFFFFFSHQIFAQFSTSEEYFKLAKIEGSEKGNFAVAADNCEKALKITPLDMDIKEYLGKCYMELGQLEKARITLLDVIVKSPRRVDARKYLLNIETQTERYSSAVCYANELLEQTPFDKTLWMKKVNLYNKMDNIIEANRTVKRLYQIFPEDEDVVNLYNGVLKEEALRLSRNRDLVKSVGQLEKALEVTLDDPELYLNLINAHIILGNYKDALAVADQGLYYIPNNEDILKKKIGILEQLHDYQSAMDIVKVQLNRGNSAYYSNLYRYLLSESARYHRNSDPFELYGQVYEIDSSNKDAYDYLLNTAIARGYFGAAQELLYKGLKSNPNSKELLSKQLHLYEMQQNKDGERAVVDKLYKLYPQDSDVAEKYRKVSFEQAKIDYQDQNFKDALPAFQKLANHPEYGKSANQYIYGIYVSQRSYDQALDLINKMIQKYPKEYQYTLRKIDLYAEMGDFDSAYDLAITSQEANPEIIEYEFMVNELSVKYIKYLLEREDYERVKIIADNMIQLDPKDQLGYQYAITARVSMSEYDEAIVVINAALSEYPESKEYRLKLAGVYSEAGKNDEAINVLKGLVVEYPYNLLIRDAYIEALFKKGKILQDSKKYTLAEAVYREILSLKPSDPVAGLKLTIVLTESRDYLKALVEVDKSLKYNKGNNDLLLAKGVVYEKLKDWSRALEFQSQYIPPYYKLEAHNDHLEYLRSKLLKNELGISYLSARTDSIPVNTSLASLEYVRYGRYDVYTGRLNYAARSTGVGVQAEFDWTINNDNKSSFLVNLGIGNKYFPDYKVGISYFKPFRVDWTAELGLRYAKLTDGRDFFTALGGVERTINNIWLNGKVFVMTDTKDLYSAILLQSRFYLDNERDFITAMTSIGSAPEDPRLDFQVNTLISYINTMVGAGYHRFLTHRTSFAVLGNWYTYRFTSTSYVNQYNLLLSLRTKF